MELFRFKHSILLVVFWKPVKNLSNIHVKFILKNIFSIVRGVEKVPNFQSNAMNFDLRKEKQFSTSQSSSRARLIQCRRKYYLTAVVPTRLQEFIFETS